VVLAVTIWISYRSADWLVAMLGPSASRIVTRLTAFLLLCVGVQILVNGIGDVFEPLLDAVNSVGRRGE
jgi:multiple antibiotic resistance protein